MNEDNKNQRQDKLPEVEIDTVKPADEHDGGEAVVTKSSFAKRIENFFYHYKWHTAAIAFVLIVAIVCTVTMCKREKIDIQIIYAGNTEISDDKDSSQRRELLTALNTISEKDGGKSPAMSLSFYLCMFEDEIKKRNEDDDNENDIDYYKEKAIANDFASVNEIMQYGSVSKTFLMFISPELYDYHAEKGSEDGEILIFTNLSYLREKNQNVEFYDGGYAIKLSSLDAYTNTELSNILPPDTLLVLRAPGGVRTNSSKKAFETSKELIEDIITY